MEDTDTKRPIKVAFYTSTPRAFRTTLLGHLYEICQKYPTTLLSERLDRETEKILQDKQLFPCLEKIIAVRQFTGEKTNIFLQNSRLAKQAGLLMEKLNPKIVISGSDYTSLFELYLFRAAKKAGALTLAIEPSLPLAETKTVQRWIELTLIYTKFPKILPILLRKASVRIRKYLGHFFIYWVLPMSMGQKPFRGKSSYILRSGNSGMRDADFQAVLSKKDYELYRKSGVPEEKLFILEHPFFSQSTSRVFDKLYAASDNRPIKQGDYPSVSVMLPNEIVVGFRKQSYQVIPRRDKEKEWQELILIIANSLPGWTIYIKPHPDGINLADLKAKLRAVSEKIVVLDPQSPAELYTKISDAVIGLPPPASTTLFTALVQSPKKPVLAVDTERDMIGDYYKDFDGVEYITNKEDFIQILELIRDGKYIKKKEQSNPEGLSSAVELIEYLMAKEGARKTCLVYD